MQYLIISLLIIKITPKLFFAYVFTGWKEEREEKA